MIIIPLFLSVLLLEVERSNAQTIDCSSGTYMYGVFVDTLGSGFADSTEIRPINYATGVIGPLMGGKKYWIRKQYSFAPNPLRYYYGSSAMGVDGVTKRFYLMTQMSNPVPKDIIAIDPTAATPAAAVTIIGTTPASLNNYHFVKIAIAPFGGYGYAVGVLRDSTIVGYTASNYNPVIRFRTCVTTNCSTIELLGYLSGTGNTYKTKMFNGDIAFDAYGNMFFAIAAFEIVGGIPRYTDARLFRINASNIPSTPGTGIIPLDFISDFNTLDSTVVNGIAFDPLGNMFFATRRFTAVQTSPAGHANSELYSASITGTAVKHPAFNTVLTMPDKSVSDLGSCYFPNFLLAENNVQLTGRFELGKAQLKWKVNNNNRVNFYEVQRSYDGTQYTTLVRIDPPNTIQASATYQYKDTLNELSKNAYYRIRETMTNGIRFYSNIAQVYSNSNMRVIGGLNPNPCIDHFNINVALKSQQSVGVKVIDQSGRTVYKTRFSGVPGENKLIINNMNNLRRGIYVVEISVNNESTREKLIKL